MLGSWTKPTLTGKLKIKKIAKQKSLLKTGQTDSSKRIFIGHFCSQLIGLAS